MSTETHFCVAHVRLVKKRDILYAKRDLIYAKRDLLYAKRDLVRVLLV